MAYLYNDPVDFADEMIEGFVAANSQWVRAVTGGVVRAAPNPRGRVAVVIGGGSGHYPAFAGLVGSGVAAGAAMGNVFASPSAQQVHGVAVAAENGGGVLFSYGNYAGDVLNFDQAETRLNREGIPARTVVVTDDISSATKGDEGRRRGIAGGLFVYKIAGAAADAGSSLDEVTRLASLANARTRTIGVAFSGCTLPGSATPLFTVAPGTMEIGMGVHGEPGIEEGEVPTADALAARLVSTLLDELPAGVRSDGARVALILNGLGSLKTEELFVVYRRIATLLDQRNVTIVEPEVGEFVTSFEMAGCSLTLCWLTPELEQLWNAPAFTPTYKKAAKSSGLVREIAEREPATVGDDVKLDSGTPARNTSTKDSRRAAFAVSAAFARARSVIDYEVVELGRLDAIAGDGDHGIGMQRGVTAAAAAARLATDAGAGVGSVLEEAGDAWSNRGGGSSGALWGLGLQKAGELLGDTDAPDGRAIVAAVQGAADEIARVGKATRGDKTMLDAVLPFLHELKAAVSAGESVEVAWGRAALQASSAARATADLTPRIGRARPHAEKSVGTPDPGAVSFALIVGSALQVSVEGENDE